MGCEPSWNTYTHTHIYMVNTLSYIPGELIKLHLWVPLFSLSKGLGESLDYETTSDDMKEKFGTIIACTCMC